MLAADVVAYADGGGKGFAFPRPVHGREKVARLLQAGAAQGERLGVVAMRLAEINGQPGAMFLDLDGVPPWPRLAGHRGRPGANAARREQPGEARAPPSAVRATVLEER